MYLLKLTKKCRPSLKRQYAEVDCDIVKAYEFEERKKQIKLIFSHIKPRTDVVSPSQSQQVEPTHQFE